MAALAVVLLVAASAGSGAMQQAAGAPQRDLPPTTTGAATISGEVMDDATTLPLERVLIDLKSADGSSRPARTDSQGRFQFEHVAACRCDLTATLGGYLTTRYGQTAPKSLDLHPVAPRVK